MGLLNAFKKGDKCPLCRQGLPAKQRLFFDATLKGQRPGADEFDLCPGCFAAKIEEYLKAFRGRAVAVYPMPGFNAYQFYPFARMAELNFTPEQIDGFTNLLPPEGSQCACGAPANFSWCSPEVYHSDPFLAQGFNAAGAFGHGYLCGGCFGRTLTNHIKAHRLTFDEFNPPVVSDGLLTSFQI
jgi:hypothetical protein